MDLRQKLTTACLFIIIFIALISIMGNWLDGDKTDLTPMNYTIVQNDTLWKIANQYKPESMSYEQYIYELRQVNEKSIEDLKVGQTITILTKGE